MDTTTADWTHRPERTDHEPPTGTTVCFGCRCYGCGEPTDGPRDPRTDTRTDLDDPTSHRWCFE